MQTQPTHPTIIVATDDSRFSDRLTELLLRADVRTIRFARCDDAAAIIRELLPDLVILHIPREQLHIGWECCKRLQRDPQTATIPVLVYAPVVAPRGAPNADGVIPDTTIAAADSLLTRMTALIAPLEHAEPAVRNQDANDSLPLGRDDL